jgi:hypothetical protein
LLLVDSAPIIYTLEDHPRFAAHFLPIFESHAAGSLRFAVSPVTIAEVLTGPLKSGDGDTLLNPHLQKQARAAD